MPDRYRNFTELLQNEVEGRDFRITRHKRRSPVLIMAPHGGNIEPYTAEIAAAIAGSDFSLYTFAGLKTENKWYLHITSENFDEARAVEAVREAAVVVTVHGLRESVQQFVCVGGLHSGLRSRLKADLAGAGIEVRDVPKMMGMSPLNICNRGMGGRGLQLEISYALRRALMENSEDLHRFERALRLALAACCPVR